jgi:phage terminase small subunit
MPLAKADKRRGKGSSYPKGKVYNEKHKKFLEVYLSSGMKLSDAYKAVKGWPADRVLTGFEKRTAYSRYLMHPRIQEAVQAAHQRVAIQTEKLIEAYAVTKEDVLKELAKIAFTNPTDVMTWKDGEGVTVKSSDDIHPDKIGAITEIYERKDKKVSVKMVDKRQALVDLGKALGLFTEKHEHKHQAVNVNFTIEK